MSAAGVPRQLCQYLAANMALIEGIFKAWGLDLSLGVSRREFDMAMHHLSLPALPNDVDSCFERFGKPDGSGGVPPHIDFRLLKSAIRHTGGGLDQQAQVRNSLLDDTPFTLSGAPSAARVKPDPKGGKRFTENFDKGPIPLPGPNVPDRGRGPLDQQGVSRHNEFDTQPFTIDGSPPRQADPAQLDQLGGARFRLLDGGPLCMANAHLARPSLPMPGTSPPRHKVPTPESNQRLFPEYHSPPPRYRASQQEHNAETAYIFEGHESSRFGERRRNLRPRPGRQLEVPTSLVPPTSGSALEMMAAFRRGEAFEREMARLRGRITQAQNSHRSPPLLESNLIASCFEAPQPTASPRLPAWSRGWKRA